MDKHILIAIIVGGINLILGSLFFFFSTQHEEYQKNVKKIIKRFFVSPHQLLLVLTILGTIAMALSKIGARAGGLFALGVLTAFCFEKMLMRFGKNDQNVCLETNMAAGVLVVGFVLLLFSVFSVFHIDLILMLPYILGIVLSMFFFEIYSKILIKTMGNIISGLEKTTSAFSEKGKVMDIMLITILIAMITGSQTMSGAIIPIIFLSLSSIIFLIYLFAWKIIKNSSSEAIKKSLFWIAFVGLALGSFFTIKVMEMPLNVLWPFIAGLTVAVLLYVVAKKFQKIIKFVSFTGILYLSSAFVFRFGGIYSLAIFAMGFATLTFIATSFVKEDTKSLLDGAVILSSVVLLVFFMGKFNIFVLDLSIGRVLFGLMSGAVAMVAIPMIFKEIFKKGMEKVKEEIPRTQNGNYKKLTQKIAELSTEAIIAVLIFIPVLPLAILSILGVQSFIACVAGLMISAFPFLLADEEVGREILSAICLLCVLAMVLL